MSEYDLESLRGLEKRLAEASGADRELDHRIWCAMQGVSFEYYEERGSSERYGWGSGRLNFRDWHTGGKYTASLDAAIALAERVLPGWGYFIRKDEEGCNAALLYPEALRVTPGAAQHPTSQPLALCLAIVRALIAEQPAKQPDTIARKAADGSQK